MKAFPKFKISRLARLNGTESRLNPTIFNDRFFILYSIRGAITSIFQKHCFTHDRMVLVDFGCGGMPYRQIFESCVREYIGVDLPGNPNADLYSSMDSKTGLPDETADVVLSTQVLEHVNSPADYLRECFRILKPKGVLILSTHGYWPYHPNPSDLWRWTSGGLSKIICEAGFEISEVQGLMGLAPTAVQLFQDAVTPKVPKCLRPLLVFSMQSLISLLDRTCSQSEKKRDACVLMVVASRKGDNRVATKH